MAKIKDINKKLLSKEISAKELTEQYISRINVLNPEINAFTMVTAEEARMAADIVDRKIRGSVEIGVFAGIPMTLKDNICTKGYETNCCSEILRGFMPAYDATAWARLKERDTVLLGKTNMDEFAMGCTTETSCFGVTRNPHNSDFVSGGSSGGSAAAVAAGFAQFALGSDTGGSVRQPAGFCGCVGFKPSYGTISRYGLIAYASSLDQIGVISSSVEDAALVFDAVSGFDPMDSTSKSDYTANTFSFLNKDIKGKRIGIPEELLMRACEEVKASVIKSASVFERLGAIVEYISMPKLTLALPAYYIIACAEASSNLARYDGVRYGRRTSGFESIHEMICKTRSRYFGDEVKKRILLGTFVLSEGYYHKYYHKAQNLRAELIKDFDKVFSRYDALLTPTVPETAYKIGRIQNDRDSSFNSDLCTVPANLAGLPAISLPSGKDSKGLPIGIQLIGRKFGETELLNIANAFEIACDYVPDSEMGARL